MALPLWSSGHILFHEGIAEKAEVFPRSHPPHPAATDC
jgi:hypothetical protein